MEALPSWSVREFNAEAAETLERELGLFPATAQILAGRGIEDVEAAEAFLEPSLDGMHSPFAFVEMEAAVDRLLAAARAGERIVVHGDYDVDGITGTVVLLLALRAVGADVDYIVPHRIDDGYGLKARGIDRARDMGAKIVVAVDCGITAHGAAERAAELGIDLIVVDHHRPGSEIPQALAILNPCVPGAGYPEDDLAAVGVAFKLARGVLERHPKGMRGTALLKLVALGTVADLVPLTGENRVVTHHGLASLAEVVNPGLRALMTLAGVRAPISTTDVGFRIAPRINAVGRLGHPRDAVEMFLASDPAKAKRLAQLLHETNTRRRQVEGEVVESALEQQPPPETGVVVASGSGWHRGVIGIVASRLVEAWGRPAVVLSVEGETAYGSARSIPGFDIVAALGGVGELLQEYGGHKQAAGMQLASVNVGPLREALAASGGDELAAAIERSARLLCDAELVLDESAIGLALELERLAPFGIGNPRPRFVCRDLHVEAEPELIKNEHTKLRVAAADRTIDAMVWRQPELAEQVSKGARIDAVAKLGLNRWGGRIEPQLEIIAVELG